ncbi:MAG: hypothetical protein GQ581_05635 [Methyloprofundus sp.]|nr:hypothetical protein [Methyloprofundus sp.]
MQTKNLSLLILLTSFFSQPVVAVPILSVGISGTLTQVATDSTNLLRADGLALSSFNGEIATS